MYSRMTNFWIKDGDRSIGGSGPLAWAAFALTLVFLYLFVPPFTKLVDDIIHFVEMLLVIVVIVVVGVGAGYFFANRR